MKQNSGFSLIELLIIISVISVVSIGGLTFFSNTRTKARDSVRKTDLVKLATALELYAQQHNLSYIDGTPNLEGNCTSSDTTAFYTGIAPYMSDGIVPTDPQTRTNYCYISINNGQTFRIFTNMENTPEANLTGCTGTYDYSVVSDNSTLACPP